MYIQTIVLINTNVVEFFLETTFETYDNDIIVLIKDILVKCQDGQMVRLL